MAMKNWINNGYCGLLVMATGTGKTITALGCLEKATSKEKSWVTVIACPQNHLSQQWKKELNNFGVKCEKIIIADKTNRNWKRNLADYLLDIHLDHKKNLIVLTTHRTLASDDFRNIVRDHKKQTKTLLIADEVHGLGASNNKKGLMNEYDMRLGLSATPQRWFDDEGTEEIYKYFKDVVYEFGIDKALSTINPITGKTYLTPYRYIPKFVSLNEEELEEYIKKTRSIIKKLTQSKDDETKKSTIDFLIYSRANIIKNVGQKFNVFSEIITDLKPNIKSTITFCSPQQIDQVMEILSQNGIVAHRFTENEGTESETKYGGLSQREYLLKKFTEKVYQTLVALKCLDEGVDVPNAETAIFMSSSTNPREYIQRIGRVIRRTLGKEEARIYDIIVVPSLVNFPPEWREIEIKILEKELLRAEGIASNAINNASALRELENARNPHYNPRKGDHK
jgi:superfamily II DNA or RNA helicase